ncbi:hypothetical protein Msil_2174 [Methylocella silvestris BL2]|uniref:Uncharacterized protein n=1 Tax=Methylocella silvestris (strain DSM 15510 / CIP 108128 / LMG 27833 / NCIMB 13906 / BL2) TaxID=395965 RepID=B8ESX4_METSB|nr:hypothetical protein [Methylocella silvestris]ACK51112.1 hypothetical protein Msil_2174 [Methylocella silvestris BL2]
MESTGLSSGTTFLVEAAKAFFRKIYHCSAFAASVPLDKSLSWTPTLSFKINNHLTVAVEVSENPYPLILQLRRTDVLRLQMPVSVYCICPEEAYLADQTGAKALINDGYGLVTVAADGSSQRRAPCIPLIQEIVQQEFEAEIKPLPRMIKTRLAESFDRYKHNAPTGAADIAEVMEGMILRAGRDAAKKKWIAQADAKPGATAKTLAAMDAAPQFQNCRAAIGAAQAYISMYRNSAHHFPKDNRQAAKKYRDCRHGFLEGLKKIGFFRDEMRKAGLSGRL